MLQLPHWHVRDTMAALAEVTPELIGGFMSKVMENGAALEMLCYGNLDDAQARCKCLVAVGDDTKSKGSIFPSTNYFGRVFAQENTVDG